jgi:2-haloacid dehalogenase
MGTTAIEAVVFDVGGVLLDWNPRHLYRKLFEEHEEMDHFLEEICTLQWHAKHDRGYPTDRSCAELAARHPEHAEEIWAWAHRSEEMIAGPIDGTVEILRELLDAGVRCFALTNMEPETYPRRLERYPFMRWFEGTVVSGFEGISKPDPEIFELLLGRFGLEPATTLMIDDSPLNIGTARSLGMRTVQFSSPPALRAALNEAGLLEAATSSASS